VIALGGIFHAQGMKFRRVTYVGDGEVDRFINLGIVPKIVFIRESSGNQEIIVCDNNGNAWSDSVGEIADCWIGSTVNIGTNFMNLNTGTAAYLVYAYG